MRLTDRFRPDDANGNYETNGLDVVCLVNYLKGIRPKPVSGECVSEALTPPGAAVELINDKIEAGGME